MQNKESFQDLFSILDKKNISYISLDLPGFGGTSLISNNMQIEDYGKFVIAFIEKQELKNPILVGHSFGGRVSIYLGSFYKNISKIVLI
jgi:pimeloyl-ACP methyl ester carboxylesterase